MRRWTVGGIGLLTLLISACAPLLDVEQTPTAELINREQFARETTAIAQVAQLQATDVAGTAQAAETYVAARESINAQLVLTLRAAIPPTQQQIDSSGLVTPGMNAPITTPSAPDASGDAGGSAAANTGGTQFVDLATAAVVSDVDGCASPATSSFSTTTQRIYATARAYNIRAGTQMSADWLRDGVVVFQSASWSVSADEADFCLWFYIEPVDVAFDVGNWSVQLYADGTPITPAAAFTIG
jgi:hypothetical protein